MNEPTRVAVVTGAARGVGRAVVHRLTAMGWAVAGVDAPGLDPALGYRLSTEAELDETCREAPGPGVARAFVADVRDRARLGAVVAEVEDVWGGLDVAIACAGAIAGGDRQWELAPEAEDAMIDINLRGVLNLSRVAVPVMLERPEPRTGRFVAVASAAATRGLPRLAAYCASKAAPEQFGPSPSNSAATASPQTP